MWLLHHAHERQQAEENRIGGRRVPSSVSVTNPWHQWYINRQSLAKTRHVCRCVCSTHLLIVPLVCREAWNTLSKRPPASAGRAFLTPTVALHAQLKELATMNSKTISSANQALILLISTNCLNLIWTPPTPLPRPQNRDQSPGRELLPGLSYQGRASVMILHKSAASLVCVPQLRCTKTRCTTLAQIEVMIVLIVK